MMQPGANNLITDVPGILVGNAEDPALKSGVSVVTSDASLVASYAVMGGAPGTRETDLLEPDKSAPSVDALVLSGGSAFGLDAASGVADGLRKAGRGFAVGRAVVPLVPMAILFDLLNGGDKDWGQNPYPALGAAALADAGTRFDLGSVGAGTGALTALHKGGLGSASFVLPSGHTVGALVAVNPMGSVTPPDSRHFWAGQLEIDGEFGGLGPDPRAGLGTEFHSLKHERMFAAAEGTNTTIAIVATDAPLTKAEAKRMATAAHDGIGRAILPAHAPFDGDLVFAASTGRNSIAPDGPTQALLGHAAALCLSRAIARGVYHALPAPGDLLPCWRETDA